MITDREKKTNNMKRTGEQGQRNKGRGWHTGNSEVKQQRKKGEGERKARG